MLLNPKHINSAGPYSIVIIGAGNVGSHLARKLHQAGHRILCIFARNGQKAAGLAGETGAGWTGRPEDVPEQADFYLLAVPDDAIGGVARRFRNSRGTWLHTSGATPLEIFAPLKEDYGVLYPVQSLSREQPAPAGEIPFLVEGSSPAVTGSIRDLALSISGRVMEADSQSRLVVHLAAVFANNFTNHMVTIAGRILARQQADPDILVPLIEETFSRIARTGPGKSQTGPAARGDDETIRRHLELLSGDPDWEKIYTFISRDIRRLRQ